MTTQSSQSESLANQVDLDLRGELTYEEYLCLDEILGAQRPRSDPEHHDELLFIIQHQTSELWMKLIRHELHAAVKHIQNDALHPCFKILARVKQIQLQLFNQWAVLETLTPSEYVKFRDGLGKASGFQSFQFREIEMLFGNKMAASIEVFRYNPELHEHMQGVLQAPGIYDEFLLYLQRHDHDVPQASVERDWAAAYEFQGGLIPVLKRIYDNPEEHWAAYEMCEKLLDLQENFELWRFRHVKMVERIIGFKMGTGGSSGVNFLRKRLEHVYFPELLAVRTEIGN